MSQLNRDEHFYDAMWEEWGDMIRYSPAPRIRRSKIISWIKDINISSLLDVGCGNGEFLLQTHRALPALGLAGADISAAVIKANQEKMPGIEFFPLDLNNQVIAKSFDAVVCMEVVEHCADYQSAIKNLCAMTDKWLFLTVPCGPLFEIDRRVGHTRHFFAQDVSDVVEQAGLKVMKIQKWGFPFFNLYKHAINMYPDRICEKFLSSKAYGSAEKIIATGTYAAFKLSLPWGGYQLFIAASR